jgi:hypothetical protein
VLGASWTVFAHAFRYSERRGATSNEQLYLVIGIPLALNVLLYLAFTANVNQRFTDFQRAMDARFVDLKDTWRSELKRVEEVLERA